MEKPEDKEIAERIERIQKCGDAIFWHIKKHDLQAYDALILLTGLFKAVQNMFSPEEQVSFQALFISMLDSKYEPKETKNETN